MSEMTPEVPKIYIQILDLSQELLLNCESQVLIIIFSPLNHACTRLHTHTARKQRPESLQGRPAFSSCYTTAKCIVTNTSNGLGFFKFSSVF